MMPGFFAADFMGEMNHIPAEGAGAVAGTALGPLPLAAPAHGRLVVCMRPEALRGGRGAASLGRARVRDAAFFGTHVRAHLVPEAAPELVLTAHLPPARLPAAGETLILSADPDAIRVFPAGPSA